MNHPNSDPDAPCVLLVEDGRELASAMIRTLKARGFSVLSATRYAHALVLIQREDQRLDAAILDHYLPDGDSRELVAALANRNPSVCSLVLTGRGDDELARDYLHRGAFRFATKPILGTQLVALVNDTIHHTHRWRRALGQVVKNAKTPPPAVVPDFEHAAERLRHIAGLSRTETIVTYWMLQGLRDAEIAQKLGRAERTAKRHVSQVLSKVRVKNRGSLWNVLSHDSGPSLEDEAGVAAGVEIEDEDEIEAGLDLDLDADENGGPGLDDSDCARLQPPP